MIISLIAARAANGVIGTDNRLPWHLPDDMKFFMQTTSGHAVIMGRKNYMSIPEKFRPLPNRLNIVLTRNTDFVAPGCSVVHQPQQALEAAATFGKDEIFIIGGADIYQLYIGVANRLYLTEIHAEVKGNTYFPEFDQSKWSEQSRVHHPADERHTFAFDFVLLERRPNP